MTSVKRVHNFNAGPSAMPVSVLEKAQADLLSFEGCGMSVMEMSHRSKEFEGIINTAEADLRELMGIPANYKVMFLQGGATLHFAMQAMNFRPAGASADYIVTGAWSKAAVKEAVKLGATNIAFSGDADKFSRLPAASELKFDPQAAYVHFCHNETIHGVEFKDEPVVPAGVPLMCDVSSDFLSGPLDVSKYAMIYAGAQKNAGPAGVVVVIVRDDMLERVPANLPVMLDYKAMAEAASLHNTPPCWSIYICGLVMDWLLSIGGLTEMKKINEKKAKLLYDCIDRSKLFSCAIDKDSRSIMNVRFTTGSEELDAKFVKESAAAGMSNLKAHRSTGGLRASIYNAVPYEGVEFLVSFIKDFEKNNG